MQKHQNIPQTTPAQLLALNPQKHFEALQTLNDFINLTAFEEAEEVLDDVMTEFITSKVFCKDAPLQYRRKILHTFLELKKMFQRLREVERK